MVRIRQGWLVAVLGLGLALVSVTACKKDEKKTDTATGDKSADKATQDQAAPTAEKAPGATGTASGDDLALLPVDSEAVIGVNFSQVQQSALWKQFVEPRMMAGDTAHKIAEFKDKCGFDPMTTLKSLSIGGKGFGGAKPDIVIVAHGLDKAKTWACLDKMKDDIGKDGSQVTRDGDVALMKDKNGDQFGFTFVNDSTVIMVNGDKANTAGVKAASAGGSALKSSPMFVDMYGKIRSADSVWFLLNGRAKIFEKVGAMGVKPVAMFGSVNVTDGLALDLSLRLDTPDAAAQLANMAKAQVKQAATMFDKIDINNDGPDVKVTVVLSNQKLNALITQVAPMLGALGGMGGAGTP